MFSLPANLLLWETADADVQRDADAAIYLYKPPECMWDRRFSAHTSHPVLLQTEIFNITEKLNLALEIH